MKEQLALAEWMVRRVSNHFVHQTPVDLEPLVKGLGARVEYIPGLPVWGRVAPEFSSPVVQLRSLRVSGSRSLLAWEAGQRVREIPAHCYDARTRFTLAHELGHLCMDSLRDENPGLRRILDRGDALTEYLCDDFAGSVLMPALWMDGRLSETPSIGEVRRTAVSARVSLSAVAVRARRLGRAVMLVRWARSQPGSWNATAGVGFRQTALHSMQIGGESGATLEGIGLKATAHVETTFRCNGHEHAIAGEIRRTFHTCVMVVHTIDDRRLGLRAWRCPGPS